MQTTFKTCVIFQIIFASNCRAFISLDTSPFKYHRKSYSTFEFAATENDVQVISNVFSTSACELLHDLSEQHNQRTNDGSSIFIRPPKNDLPLTPIENAIDSFLKQLGDTSQKVEYWSRSEYMNIDTHADIDEQHLKDSGEVRCPKNGHVLYLKVKKNLRGPTCVFPHQRKQWRNNDDLSENILLITVPAVEGRILRFPGSAMHAVPKPFYRWLLNKEEVKALVQDEKCEEFDFDDDEWNEEDNDYLDDEDIERSVLLFNTWYDDEEGPKAVSGDYATGALPEGIELSEEDMKAFLQTEQSKLLKEWENSFGKHGQKVQCKPKSQWIMEDFEDSARGTTDAKINVSLMGDSKRHSYHSKFATLEVNANILEKALGEVSNVSEVYLSIPKERE